MRAITFIIAAILCATATAKSSGCNLCSETYNLQFFTGVLAQLVERLKGIEEVTGSNPVGSIFFCTSPRRVASATTSRESAIGYGVLHGNKRVTFPVQRAARTAAILRA
jgi:hypothetical protein